MITKRIKELKYIHDGVMYTTKIATQNPGSCLGCVLKGTPFCSIVITDLNCPCCRETWKDKKYRIWIKVKKQFKIKSIIYDTNDLVMFEKIVYNIIAIDGAKEYYTLYGFDSKTIYIPFCEERQLTKVGICQ